MKVSASRLSVLPHCQYWARDNVQAPPDRPSELSDTGKAVHALIEAGATGRMFDGFPPLADATKAGKLYETWRQWWPSYSRDRPWRYEIAYLFDWKTRKVREMPAEWVKGNREREPEEIPAIVDAVSNATVLDWKSGSRRDASDQLKLGALCASTAHGWSEVETAPVYLRVRKIDPPELVTYDAFDLAEFGDSISVLMSGRNKAEPKPGEHCYRCPLRQRAEDGQPYCPALRAPEIIDPIEYRRESA